MAEERFSGTSAWAISDMPEAEAIQVMEAISAMADSPSVADRMYASDQFNTAAEHPSAKVVARAVDVSRWLISHELYGGSHDFSGLDELLPDDPHADFTIEVDGVPRSFKLSDDPLPLPVHPQIQKNVIRELARAGARPEAQLLEIAEQAVDIIGVLALKSLDAPEARLALGWVGRETAHKSVAETALGYLGGVVMHDARQLILIEPEDKLRHALIGLHAIGERSDGLLRADVLTVIDSARLAFSDARFDDVFVRAANRQLGGSPFTEYPRS